MLHTPRPAPYPGHNPAGPLRIDNSIARPPSLSVPDKGPRTLPVRGPLSVGQKPPVPFGVPRPVGQVPWPPEVTSKFEEWVYG